MAFMILRCSCGTSGQNVKVKSADVSRKPSLEVSELNGPDLMRSFNHTVHYAAECHNSIAFKTKSAQHVARPSSATRCGYRSVDSVHPFITYMPWTDERNLVHFSQNQTIHFLANMLIFYISTVLNSGHRFLRERLK